MTTREIEIPSGKLTAYTASPIVSRGVAVLVLPEIYNLNGWIRKVAERYAGLGFEVLVPDLYWRQTPDPQLDYNPADQQTGRQLASVLDREVATNDLAEIVRAWRAELPEGTPVIAVGYCLGGELAFLLAASGTVDGASGYYPTRMENHLQHGTAVKAPTQLHFGELDYRTPGELIDLVRQATVESQKVEIIVHAGADHGFGRFGHPPYHAAAAALAQTRTLALADALIGQRH
ncbi:dienelactone hydrolase family protein [Pseudomonas typographi]|uniref:dienelactone hydrolase family protein n=1 Tax=Pseudomonas typographi TaxID=2715964 RepID=UPI001684070C|nr:dienelactone hydrolase family protein [Pseudomonas typographi]MBD1589836.1 dienelactone hydrolase family protein [Pseudomonas typographi]